MQWAEDGGAWRRGIEEAKAQLGCSGIEEGEEEEDDDDEEEEEEEDGDDEDEEE